MGLPLHALKILAPHLKGAKVLSLSYPDITVSAETIKAEFGFTPEWFTDRAQFHLLGFQLPETRHVFEHFGADLDCSDVVEATGAEKVVDLNYEADLGKYDVVIDPGTIEHCFNVGQALLNAAHAVKPGGLIFHISPMDMMNHGFYNFNPTLFYDFYGQNGWGMERLEAMAENPTNFHPVKRFFAKMEHNIVCLARRRTDARMKFPIQRKYLKAINEARAA